MLDKRAQNGTKLCGCTRKYDGCWEAPCNDCRCDKATSDVTESWHFQLWMGGVANTSKFRSTACNLATFQSSPFGDSHRRKQFLSSRSALIFFSFCKFSRPVRAEGCRDVPGCRQLCEAPMSDPVEQFPICNQGASFIHTCE